MERRSSSPNHRAPWCAGRVFGCLFDDPTGLANRHAIGSDAMLFETDYPHSDGTWPHSRAVAHRICSAAGLDERGGLRIAAGQRHLLPRARALSGSPS